MREIITSAVPETSPLDASRLGGLMRDFTCGLKQQMFYWGLDVVHPAGNLLAAQGFAKTKSAGLQGTSCYGLESQGGRIELHGSCVGWYGPQRGFVFVRPWAKCFAWMGNGSPVPGEWDAALLEDPGPIALREHSLPFLQWWLESERWIAARQGNSYRVDCQRRFKRMPRTRPWLAPDQAQRWLGRFHEDPRGLERAKRFKG
jgi:hypothetical protein